MSSLYIYICHIVNILYRCIFIIILPSGVVTHPGVLAFWKLRQEALEFEPNLGYIGKLHLELEQPNQPNE